MNAALYKIVKLLFLPGIPFVGMCANNPHISRKVSGNPSIVLWDTISMSLTE